MVPIKWVWKCLDSTNLSWISYFELNGRKKNPINRIMQIIIK